MDNGYTPQLLVDAAWPNVSVPEQFVSDDRIVLNIHDQAVQGLEISNDWILFNARFGGVVHQIDIPIDSVLGVFSRETQQGMAFAAQDVEDIDSAGASGEYSAVEADLPSSRPNLRIVR